MCGIIGFLGTSSRQTIDGATLTKMRDTMVHRGPDGAGLWISDDSRVGFGHRRLSIVDLSEGAHQPMFDGTGKIVITYNGEIYNHAALRKEMEAAGRRFRTDHSDTEVIVEGLAHWGIDGLVQRIDGDYGFGLWDGREEALYLVRDRVGVKPLYLWAGNGRFIFASEIKAILAHPQVVPCGPSSSAIPAAFSSSRRRSASAKFFAFFAAARSPIMRSMAASSSPLAAAAPPRR